MVMAILLCAAAFFLAAAGYEGGVMAFTSIGTTSLIALQGKNILDSRPRPPIRVPHGSPRGAQDAGGGPVGQLEDER